MNQQNEKAPVAANEQGAQIINQLQDTTDWSNCQEPVDPFLLESMEILIPGESVKISPERFFGLFNFGSYDVDGSGRYSATVQGVEFFCLVSKGKNHDLE